MIIVTVEVHGSDKAPGSATSKQKEEGSDSNQCRYHSYVQSNHCSDRLVLSCHLSLLVQKVRFLSIPCMIRCD